MSVEAEMSVLGCMMLDDEFCREAIDSLTEEQERYLNSWQL